jgi:thiamine biosynthesis protein ThiI
LVRYGEIGLKAKETRKRFERCLQKNIQYALQTQKIPCTIKKSLGRIYVHTDLIDQSLSILKNIFGIVSVSPTLETISDIEQIAATALEIAKQKIHPNNSFAIRATRTGFHTFSSQDVAIRVGQDIVNTLHNPVDLTNPDQEIYIDIRDERAFIFTKKIFGVGGLPLGSQGNVLIFVTTPHSFLAAWYLMRRGCTPIFAISSKELEPLVNKLQKKWYFITQWYRINNEKNMIIEQLQNLVDQTKSEAVVTDHFLSQNPTETIFQLMQLKKSIKVPVIHPLIAMEQKEIIKQCSEIGISL